MTQAQIQADDQVTSTHDNNSTLEKEEILTLDTMLVEPIDPPGHGFMIPLSAPRARSIITRAAIEQKNTQNNFYQTMDLVPGVNVYSRDASGLFGGGLRMRGFNDNQIGVSVDGAPVNDVSNFEVYPEQLVDLENVEEISIIQGGNNTDAPMVAASGGSINIVTTQPADDFLIRAQQSYGAYNSYKSYLRLDTGYLGDGFFKAFLSLSNAGTKKWKGQGDADRKHVDFKSVFNLSSNSSITIGVLYNEKFNHHLRSLTLDQINTLGRDADFGTKAPQHLVGVNGTAQIETPPDSFYKLRFNPYRTALATLHGRFQLSSNLRLEIDPYFSYGYGTGGNQLNLLSEGNGANSFGGGVRDINNDGDTLDTIMISSSSLTETYRPGVTARLRGEIANHRLMAGYWYEFSRQGWTKPAVTFDANGDSASVWFDDKSKYLRNQDGSYYQGEEFVTRNYSQSIFAQDDISFLDDKLVLSVGLRYTKISQDSFNKASTGSPADYNIKRTYSRFLPNAGISFQFTDKQQVFISRAENFKIPHDSVYHNLIQGGSFNAQGQFTGFTLNPVVVEEESSTTWELGYRYTGEDIFFSGTLYYVDFKDRLATAFDIDTNIFTNTNVGDSITKGLELEAAWRFVQNWSVYGSFSYIDSEIEDNLLITANTFEATAGRAFPGVPELMAGASLR
ncbi:MAG: TonB-dependent receptor, partial [Methylococcaceae bacterium]